MTTAIACNTDSVLLPQNTHVYGAIEEPTATLELFPSAEAPAQKPTSAEEA